MQQLEVRTLIKKKSIIGLVLCLFLENFGRGRQMFLQKAESGYALDPLPHFIILF